MKGRHWTEEEDRLLAEVVLQFVRDGGNQLDAFAEVARKIGRTPGACGFRWNAVVRKKEEESFKKAKKQRVANQLKKHRGPSQTLKEIIKQLRSYDIEFRNHQGKLMQLEKELREKDRQYQYIVEENERLTEEWNAIHRFRNEVQNRYTHLMKLLQSVRELEESPEEETLEGDSPFAGENTEEGDYRSGVDTDQGAGS